MVQLDARGAVRALREDHVDRLHGRDVADPFRWLEDDESTATRAWLEDQGGRFGRHRDTWVVREELHRRITAMLDRPSWSVPALFDGHALATCNPGLGDHSRLVVVDADGVRVLFDPGVGDPDALTSLDAWAPSLDGTLVAVQTSRRGTEHGRLDVLDVATGRRVDGPLDRTRVAPVAWTAGNAGFYYARMLEEPAPGRVVRRGVWWHRSGTDASRDVCVHRPRDGAAPTAPRVRTDPTGRWLLLSESHGTNHHDDVWIADLRGADPAAPTFRPVQVGLRAATSGRVGPDGLLYLLTTWGAPRRRLVRTSPEDPTTWSTVVAEDPEATLEEFALPERDGGVDVVVARTRGSSSELLRVDPEGRRGPEPIETPVVGVAAGLSAARDLVLVSVGGVDTPAAPYVVHGGSRRPEPWRPGGGSPVTDVEVRVERTRYTARDGTAVALTVIEAAGHPPGPRPTIVHAYGGFGSPRRIGFSASVLAWVEAGGRHVIAHVRGGGEEGREWHQAGAREGKLTVVTDVLDAAQWLCAQGWSTPDQLCLSGGSNGGLVMLAAAVRAPDRVGAVIAHAPLADMVRYERFGLGASWTEEFGSVANAAHFDALLSYSPYHNVIRGEHYPAVLLTGFHQDSRTGAAHPRKMCAALQDANHGPAPILLRYAFDAGHATGALTRAIDLAADVHAFAAVRTGLAR